MPPPPFFIIGTPESGATILELALCKHPQVAILPESGFFTLVKRSRRGQHRHWNRIIQLLDAKIDLPDYRIRAGSLAHKYFSRIISEYVMQLNKTGITHVGENTPEHLHSLKEILLTYPDAKFILIYRDGRDVALNLSQSSTELYLNFYIWLHDYLILKRFLQHDSHRVMCVRYEDFVTHSNQVLNMIFSFLGLKNEETTKNITSLEDVPRHYRNAGSMAENSILTCNIGQWRNELSSKAIERLEEMGGWALRELHYECMTDHKHSFFPWLNPIIYTRLFSGIVKRKVQYNIDKYLGTSFIASNRMLNKSEESKYSLSTIPYNTSVNSCDHK